MICRENHCPLDDPEFCRLLDLWVFCGREVPSIDLRPVWGSLNKTISEEKAVDKCNVYQIFWDPERVQDYWAFGGMTREVCEIIVDGYRRWKGEKLLDNGF
jgi:hypothetical protein